MPSQRDNELNNELSRLRQKARRERELRINNAGGLSAFGFTKENQELLEDDKRRLNAIGSSYDTRQSRKLRDRINKLEAARSAAIDKLDAEFDATISKINNLDVSADSSRIQMPTLDERERQAGLFLAGNDPLFGRNLLDDLPDTIGERERAAGLFNTTSGRGIAQQNQADPIAPEVDLEETFGTFPVTICIDGSPFSATIVGQIGGKIT
jgi:hypothetical protein